jgi:hypothetical protein
LAHEKTTPNHKMIEGRERENSDLLAEPPVVVYALYRVTVRVTVVVWVMPPPLAVMVMVRLPTVEFRATATVIVDLPDPGAAIELGAKVTV